MIRLAPIEDITVKEFQQLANNKAVAQHLEDIFPHPYSLNNAREFIGQASDGLFGL